MKSTGVKLNRTPDNSEMKFKRIVFIQMCLLTLLNCAIAQSNTITGKIEGKVLSTENWLVFRTYGYNQIVENSTPINSYKVPLTDVGQFELNFEAPDSCFYMEMEILTKDRKIEDLIYSLTDTRYLCELGDSIFLKINLDKKWVQFKGTGAESLDCQYQLNSISLPMQANSVIYNPLLKAESAIAKRSRFESVLLDFKYNILKTYAPVLSPYLYERIKADMLIRAKFAFLNTLPYVKTTEELKAKTKDFLMANMDSKTSLVHIDDSLAQSPAYAALVIKRAKIAYAVTEAGQQHPMPYLDWMLNLIHKNFSGMVKENLLLAFYMTDAKAYPKEMARVFPKIETMLSAHNRQLLEKAREQLAPAGTAFPFSFEDMDGKKVSLNQFIDKIVLMDFWFTGCHGCTQIPPVFKLIMEKLKDRKDVVYLSVSIDRRKEEWLRGLNSEKYTCPGQIHVFTGGLGWDDPFVAAYDFKIYPQLCLIGKNGKIISMNPPDPRKDNGEGILKLIRKER